MKNNKSFVNIILVVLIIILIGSLGYVLLNKKNSFSISFLSGKSQPVVQKEDVCPPLTPQQAEMYEGKPIPGKYQFVLDFNLDGFECKGNSWGGDFPGCDNWVPVVTTPWHVGDVVNSCFGSFEDQGSDAGWGISLRGESNAHVPMKYVIKVPDITPTTK